MNESISVNKDGRKAKRGVRVCISVPKDMYENARKMVELGLIKSLSSLWERGYRARMAEFSPEFRQQEIERLNAEADAIEEFYTNLEREGDARQQ